MIIKKENEEEKKETTEEEVYEENYGQINTAEGDLGPYTY